jgi:UTP--glucose-1-phosphate uridylyltransferase
MIRKAVIPVAGWGTRVLPASKSIPKPMLPLADQPTIQYIVEEAVQSGIEHIVFVTSRNMRAIEDYFDEIPELNAVLEAGNKQSILARLRQIESMVQISAVRQPRPRGLGHAVLMAREIIGDEPFAVMLGDDLVYNDRGTPCLKQLIDTYNVNRNGSVIGVMAVPQQEVSRYGVISGRQISSRTMQVTGMVEKPSPEIAPSNLAIIGRYILTPEIFPLLANTQPGQGSEIQLTDAMQSLLAYQPFYAYAFEGTRYDTGDTLGWLTTCIEYTLRREDLAPELKTYLRSLKLD